MTSLFFFLMIRRPPRSTLFPYATPSRSELTVTPAPKEALAPAWKFVPVTVTVRLAPGVPEVGDRLAIVGTAARLTVALAEVPSAKLAMRRSEEHTSELQSRSDLVCRLQL